MTFHSSRNAANEALKVVADVELNAENHPDIYLEAARVHAELAKAVMYTHHDGTMHEDLTPMIKMTP